MRDSVGLSTAVFHRYGVFVVKSDVSGNGLTICWEKNVKMLLVTLPQK